MKSLHEPTHTFAQFRHEIRNNLAILSSRLQLLSAKHPFLNTDDIYLQAVDDLQAVYHLMDDYQSIFDPPQLLPCDVALILQELFQTYQPLLHEKEKTLSLELSANLPIIRADARQLRQSLLNILKNADEATSKGQYIEIAAHADSCFITITIKDNGIGMTSEQQAHIFEAYTSYKQGGTGIGLHMVRATILAHHGHIDCQSFPDKGTIFRIDLPLPCNTTLREAPMHTES